MISGNKDMSHMNLLLQRSRLALLEFGPSMALMTLPGGYLIALTDWIHRRWSPGAGSTPIANSVQMKPQNLPIAGAAKE
jgi:hypothetical protein